MSAPVTTICPFCRNRHCGVRPTGYDCPDCGSFDHWPTPEQCKVALSAAAETGNDWAYLNVYTRCLEASQ